MKPMQRIVDFFAESCFCCFLARPQDYDGEEDADDGELPDITPEMEDDIEAALNTSSTVTLVSAFRMDITRKDIDTLKGLNWLNDEIINFYLQMIVERSKENDNWPNVYAFNTFFYPKIMQQVWDVI